MQSIKVNHEVPRSLLSSSYKFNDYDFCLPHLLDQDEEYLQHFLDAKSKGRYIIMDNSLHELGEAYDHKRLLHWVNEIKPDEFIIPDVWEDIVGSIENADTWSEYEFPEGVEKVAVVQAKSLHEAVECTRAYKRLGYKKIAYSYGASYYNDVCPHPNKDLGKALGRISVISTLHNQGFLTDDDRVHLLGCSVPQEFGWYEGINCVESIDTSNPVMATLDGSKYTKGGLLNKPKSNMNNHYDESLLVDNELLNHNLRKFKQINNII